MENNLISWPESEGEEIETVERIDKGKGREVVEMEYNNEWFKIVVEDRNGMEGIEEVIGTLVSFVQFNRVLKEYFFSFFLNLCFQRSGLIPIPSFKARHPIA